MKFEKPEMEKIEFDAEDIIATSMVCDSVETCPTNCSDCKNHICSSFFDAVPSNNVLN